MCDLCDPDPEKAASARKHHKSIADAFDWAADFHRNLATGIVKPHTPQAASFAPKAKWLLRELIEWI